MQTSDPRTLQPWAVDYSVVVGAVAREAHAWNVLHVLMGLRLRREYLVCARTPPATHSSCPPGKTPLADHLSYCPPGKTPLADRETGACRAKRRWQTSNACGTSCNGDRVRSWSRTTVARNSVLDTSAGGAPW